MTNRKSLPPKAKSDEPAKTRKESVTHYVEQLAIAMGQEIPLERIAIYSTALGELSERQLAYAFGRALRQCRFFPQIAELFEFADEYRAERDVEMSRAILDRGAKPPDWIPLEELKQQLRSKSLCAFPEGNSISNEDNEKRIAMLRKQAKDLLA